MQRRYATCSGPCEGYRPVNAKGLCPTCNRLKDPVKGPRTVKERPPAKSYSKRAPTGELALFRQIWADRLHVSQVSGKPIEEFDVSCFMHALNKNTYKRFRLDPRNIFLVRKEEHHAYDNEGREALKTMAGWRKVFEMRDALMLESRPARLQSG